MRQYAHPSPGRLLGASITAVEAERAVGGSLVCAREVHITAILMTSNDVTGTVIAHMFLLEL